MLASTVHGCLSSRPYVSLPRIRGHVIKTARRMLSPELALVLSQDSMPASRVPISLIFLHPSCAGFMLCAGQVRSSMASLRPHLNSCQNWLSEWVHLSPTSMVRLALLLTPSGVSAEVPAWRGPASRPLTPRAHLSLTILLPHPISHLSRPHRGGVCFFNKLNAVHHHLSIPYLLTHLCTKIHRTLKSLFFKLFVSFPHIWS